MPLLDPLPVATLTGTEHQPRLSPLPPPDTEPDALPAGAIPLHDVTVTLRSGGASVYSRPRDTSEELGQVEAGERLPAQALVFRHHTWLQIPWEHDGIAWIESDYTDFSRSTAYNHVAARWYETEAVLTYRRALVRDVLRVRGANAEMLAQVDRLTDDALFNLENTLTRRTMLPGYIKFWQMQAHLGLPDPFEVLPVQTTAAAGITQLQLNGFGPSMFAHDYWEVYYGKTRGMNNGVDYIVPEGTPLIAVADGVIVDFQPLSSPADCVLALRPYLPEQVRAADGSRVRSNVVVVYEHLTGDPTSEILQVGDEVQAGQIIGTSGCPVYTRSDGSLGIQHNNAHLHLEIHLVTDGHQDLSHRQPLNPLLFWTPRLVAFQARLAAHDSQPPYPVSGQQFGRLGFFTIGCFQYEPPTVVWRHEPSRDAIWPEGVYDLDHMLEHLGTFAPYR